jgi:hypothetical protein
VVWVIDKVEPDMGRWVSAGMGVEVEKLTLGRRLRTRDMESKRRVGSINDYRSYALNLSCEKAELLYAAFWTHSG